MFGGSTYNAFIDESGNFGYDFDKSGTSTHFVVTAVIIHPDNLEHINEQLHDVRTKYFSGGEIKSSSIGTDFVKRINILKDLSELDFFIMSYVIDKRKVRKESGLSYKKSFLKYSNDLLHTELKKDFPNLEIYSDQHGSSEYMEEFQKYFKSKEKTFFSTYEFEFVDSKENNFVQLADLMCGTIALGYNQERPQKYEVFMNFIKNRVLKILNFPLEYSEYLVKSDFMDTPDFDKVISEHCINTSLRYIENNQDSFHVEDIDRVKVVDYLLFQLQTSNPTKYVYANELIEHIAKTTGRRYSKHQFLTRIIAKLRDSGVILSSGNKGYKVPLNGNEVYSYTNHTMQVVYPMLERLRKCRKAILTATGNELDILDIEQYREIKEYFDYVKKDKI